MSRNLIDRDALIASIPKTNVDIFENCRNCTTLCDWQVKELIDKMPTIDAVEVKHGEWIEVHDWLQIPQEESGTYRCSACGQVMKYPWNYCPNCGARMKGEETDDGIHVRE